MDEFELIKTIKQNAYHQASLQCGVGDDAAVFHETTNETVVAIDTFVEGVHFTKDTMNAKQLGYRALAANFSDLAAMGAIPTYYLVSIVVPTHWGESDISAIFYGMKQLAGSFRADLIGGDTVSGHDLVLSITVIGEVERNKARYRRDAKVGDVVFVTGTLGDSRLGLHILENNLEIENRDYFIERHQLPTPRVHFAQALKSIERVALNDISDGIGSELHEIAEASNISIRINDEQIPVHPNLLRFFSEFEEKWKYFGGEDFELVGTVAAQDWSQVQLAAKKFNLPVTAIGDVIIQEENPVYVKKGDKISPLKKEGYTHLR